MKTISRRFVDLERIAIAASRFVLALMIVGLNAGDPSARAGKTAENGRYTYADLAERVLPSVVTIYVKKNLPKNRERQREQMRKFFEERPELRGMFPFPMPDKDSPDEFSERWKSFGLDDEFVPSSSGSGVIISDDGYVITNHHVLSQGMESVSKSLDRETTELSIMFHDGSEISGDDVEVIYSNSLADLALLKVKKRGLKAINWGDSEGLRIGERVAAIGSPLDLRATVTQGIVCAKNRGGFGLGGLIQTDAVINVGSSGGPLVNLDGELVGIHRLITTNTGRWQGYGFAIPSNDARHFAEEVIEKGEIEFGYLGVVMWEQGPAKLRMLAAMGLSPLEKGVLIKYVEPDSPAQSAGLRVGDFIVEVSGRKIENNMDLLDNIARQLVGTKVKVKLLRESEDRELEEETIKVNLGRRPEEGEIGEIPQRPKDESPKEEGREKDLSALGLKVKAGTTADGRPGLEVTAVSRDSRAARAGLEEGDLLVEMNRVALESIDDLEKAIENRKDRPAHVVDYERQGRRLSTTIEPAGE